MTFGSSATPIDFEDIAVGLTEQGYAVVDHFLDANEVTGCRSEAFRLSELQAFRPAGVGQGADYRRVKDVRSDLIHWVDPQSTGPATRVYLERIQQLTTFLNRTCFLGIRDAEIHYALYQPGSFYQRHLDVFRDGSARKLSVICYLNDQWQSGDGGELVMYLPEADGTETAREIEPLAGRLVCFESTRLEHEVLPAHRSRLSLTGWLKDEKLFI